MRARDRVARVALFLAMCSLVFWGANAQAVPVQATASWTPPTTGSPVHHYKVELETNGVWASMPDTTVPNYIFTLESGRTYRVRVAGVDAQGRQGPTSLPSEPYTPDLGAPGGCGKPIVVQVP